MVLLHLSRTTTCYLPFSYTMYSYLIRTPDTGTHLAYSPASRCLQCEVCWTFVWTCSHINRSASQPGQGDGPSHEPSSSEGWWLERQQWKGKSSLLFQWLVSDCFSDKMSLKIIIFLCCGGGNPFSLLQQTWGDDAISKSEAFFIYEGQFRPDLNGKVSH